MASTQQPSAGDTEPRNDAPQSAANVASSGKKPNSNYDADSLAGLVGNDNNTPEIAADHRKSWIKRVFHHEKDGDIPKRKSIADSGPLIFVVDPKTGKEVLQNNPHWPNEDSYKRLAETEGQWAFGSMAGQQNKDFGGTIG